MDSAPTDTWIKTDSQNHVWIVRERRKIIHSVDKTYPREMSAKEEAPLSGTDDDNLDQSPMEDRSEGNRKRTTKDIVREYAEHDPDPFEASLRSKKGSEVNFDNKDATSKTFSRSFLPIREVGSSQEDNGERVDGRTLCLLFSIGVFITACFLLSKQFGSFSEFYFHWSSLINSKPGVYYFGSFCFLAFLVFFFLVCAKKNDDEPLDDNVRDTTEIISHSQEPQHFTHWWMLGITVVVIFIAGIFIKGHNCDVQYFAVYFDTSHVLREGNISFILIVFVLLLLGFVLYNSGEVAGTQSSLGNMSELPNRSGIRSGTQSVMKARPLKKQKERLKIAYEAGISQEEQPYQSAKERRKTWKNEFPRTKRRTSFSGPPVSR